MKKERILVLNLTLLALLMVFGCAPENDQPNEILQSDQEAPSELVSSGDDRALIEDACKRWMKQKSADLYGEVVTPLIENDELGEECVDLTCQRVTATHPEELGYKLENREIVWWCENNFPEAEFVYGSDVFWSPEGNDFLVVYISDGCNIEQRCFRALAYECPYYRVEDIPSDLPELEDDGRSETFNNPWEDGVQGGLRQGEPTNGYLWDC